jgi:GST-like protein
MRPGLQGAGPRRGDVVRHFFGWATPNSRRVPIMLEECNLDYAVTGVNIRAREQFAPEVLAMNPYGKIPILAEDGRPIF